MGENLKTKRPPKEKNGWVILGDMHCFVLFFAVLKKKERKINK